MFCPRSLVSVSNLQGTSVTSTVVSVAPTFSVRSMCCRLPTETVMFLATASEKPGALARDGIDADAQRRHVVVADAVGLRLGDDAVVVLVMLDAAPAIGAPLASRMVPRQAAVLILSMQLGGEHKQQNSQRDVA